MIKKIQPLFKCHGSNFLSSWIIEHFPENYQNYDYIEPYCGSAHVLLNKTLPKDHVEVLNDPDPTIANIFRALRDDAAMFIGRFKKVKYCENTFERTLKKDHDELNELILRQMSRAGLKKTFKLSSEGEENGNMVEQLKNIAERVKNIYIFNKSPLEIIQAFDDINTLMYVNTPEISQTEAENHAKLANYLHQVRGKVIVSAYYNAFCKRHYKEEDGWRFIKKKTGPDIQCLILNY